MNPGLDRYSPEHGEPPCNSSYEVMEVSKGHEQQWYPIEQKFYSDHRRDEWEDHWDDHLFAEVQTFASDFNINDLKKEDVDFHYDPTTKLYFAIYSHGCVMARYVKSEEVEKDDGFYEEC